MLDVAETGTPAATGSSSRSVGMPGTLRSRNAHKASTASMIPEAAMRWPNDHLKPVTGGASCPNTRSIAVASEASDCRVPFACATITPTSAGRRCASSSAKRMASESAAPALVDRKKALRIRGVAATEHLAEDGCATARRRSWRFQQHGARALAEQAPIPVRVERADGVLREQAKPVVVDHRLGLDRRVVADRERSLGLALAQRLHRLHDRQHAAHAMVGDAGVGPLQTVSDADMAQHIVRQRAQQPHRVHRIAELAPEGTQIALAGGEQREVVVLALVASAPRPDVDPGAVVVGGCLGLAQGGAVRGQPGAFDRPIGGVQAEHVGAADELLDLAILQQRHGVQVDDLTGDPARPAGGVPLLDRRQRRLATADGAPDLGGLLAGRAQRADARYHDVLGFRHELTLACFNPAARVEVGPAIRMTA